MAANVFDYKKSLSRQSDYTRKVVEASKYNLVLLKHLKNHLGEPVMDYERQTEMESDITPGITRIAEGTDKPNTFTTYTNDLVTSVLEDAISDGYKVTRQALKLKGMRIKKDLLAEKRLQDLDALMLGVELVLGSTQECVRKTAVETKTKTRGLLSWLSPTAHTVCPFADRHLPAGEIVLSASGDGSILSEEDFKAMLKSARKKSKMPLNLYGFVGPDLHTMFVDFLCLADATKNVQRNVDYRATEIYQNVDILSYEGNKVTLVGVDTLGWDIDPTTDKPVANTTSDFTGAFFEPDKFDLEWLQHPEHVDTCKRETGSGPEGFHNAMYRLGARRLVSGFRITKATA